MRNHLPVRGAGIRVLAALALGVGLLPVRGGAAQQPASPQQRPVFRAGAEYVRVDVVVTDSDDRPVRDLTIDDFEVVEDGRRQQIADFQFVDIAVAERVIDLEAPMPPRPDVASNALPSPTSRAFVLVVDDMHLLTHDIIPTRRVMTDFLRALSPDDQVAIVFVGQSGYSTDFTNDLGSLLEPVESVRKVFGFGLGLDVVGPDVSPEHFTVALQTIDMLRNVSRSLAGSAHARRAIVFVSGGLVFDPALDAELHAEAMNLFEESARANVPIYTLDPRGAVSPEWAVRNPHSLETDRGRSRENIVRAVNANIRLQQDRMAEIAINTGGRAFIKQSDLTWAVTQIVAENGSYYLLGYYPDPYAPDGRFHDIDVRVKRPGVRVRPRKGYVAPRPSDAFAEAGPGLADSLGEGMAGGTLRLEAAATPLAPADDGRVRTAVHVRARYDAEDVRGGLVDEALLMGVLALDTDAGIRASEERRVSVGLPSGRDVFEFIEVVDLPRGRTALRVGVASRVTGRVGTVHLPVEVPDLRGRDLGAGAIVLGRAAAMEQAGEAPAGASALVPFPPTLDRAFPADETIRAFVRVMPARDAQAPARATFVLNQDGATVRALPTSCAPSVLVACALDCEAALPLRGLAPGAYVLAFTVEDDRGGMVSRAVPFGVR